MPVADALRSNYENSNIYILVNNRVKELIEDYGSINKVLGVEELNYFEIKNICKKLDIDLAVILKPEFLVALAIYSARVKYRLATGYRWYSFLFNLRHYEHRKHSIKHESEYNLNLLKELNIHINKNIKPIFKVKQHDYESATMKLVTQNFKIDKPYIVIHIPSLGSAKVWPDKYFQELIRLAVNDVNNYYQIVLTGTNEERGQVESVIKGLNDERIIMIFNLTLKELAALYSKALLFIGNSSGPIHIAAATGTFVVGFYPNTKPQNYERWGPLTEKKKIFTPDLHNDKMESIIPEKVFLFIKDYIKKLIS